MRRPRASGRPRRLGYTAAPIALPRSGPTPTMTSARPRLRFAQPPSTSRRRLFWVGATALLWLVSLLLAGWWGVRSATPHLAGVEAELRDSREKVKAQAGRISTLKQRQVNLEVSDRISRAANAELQATLAERDEQIAALRADVAFYERLVGSTSQRKGLNVHSIGFTAEAGGSWRYLAVLTQNLNRGAISQGQLRFAVEGVRAGKLSVIGWDELHQGRSIAGQGYSFRYFQQLSGSVILPKDFTPQRVRISLAGDGVSVNQLFDWQLSDSAAAN